MKRALEYTIKALLLQLFELLCQRTALLQGWRNVPSAFSPPRDISSGPFCDLLDTVGLC